MISLDTVLNKLHSEAISPQSILQDQKEAGHYYSMMDARNMLKVKGDLIDITDFSKNIFPVPVILTSEVFDLCVEMYGKDVIKLKSIVISILCQAKVAIKQANASQSEVGFNIKWFKPIFLNRKNLRASIDRNDHNQLVLMLKIG